MPKLDWIQVFKHLAFAVCAGGVCAIASVVLCLCVQGAFWVFERAWAVVWALPAFGVAELLLYRALGLRQDLGTRHVIALMRRDREISAKLAPGILLGTCMTIFCGGSVGKEAGALQMGASLGTTLAKPFKLRSVYVRNAGESMAGYVAACGMAATFSALFFAPLGSAMLVMELSNFKKSINKHIGSILVACFVAWGVARAIGIGDIIVAPECPPLDWLLVGECIIIGVACAACGSVFDSAIDWVHDLSWRICKNFYVWAVVGGVAFAALITLFGWQAFCGPGGDMLNAVLAGTYKPTDFAIKALLTLICLGFWFKGGEIMPSFCIGGLLGAACTAMTGGESIFGAMVGVVAFFAAFSRAPFAAFLLGCEIFGWSCAPSFAIAIAVAYMFGAPVGMYGEGVDRAIRTRWHTVKRNIKGDVSLNKNNGEGGARAAGAGAGAQAGAARAGDAGAARAGVGVGFGAGVDAGAARAGVGAGTSAGAGTQAVAGASGSGAGADAGARAGGSVADGGVSPSPPSQEKRREPYAIGAIARAEDAIEDIEEALNSTENKLAPESDRKV